jgi:nicotinamidase-related amidase
MAITVEANPYRWPYDGDLTAARTALILIDWQQDFCGPGGYVDKMGYDISLTRAGIAPTRAVLAACRQVPGMTVVHTREGHKPDLTDCPPNKLWRSKQIGAGIGDPGPCGRILVRGEEGWNIIPELEPLPGEPVIDKPGKGAFYQTDLELMLHNRAIDTLLVCGVTTEVCVNTTVREANDRGFRCIVLSDCCGSYFAEFHEMGLAMIKAQGGIFGSVSASKPLLRILAPVQ